MSLSFDDWDKWKAWVSIAKHPCKYYIDPFQLQIFITGKYSNHPSFISWCYCVYSLTLCGWRNSGGMMIFGGWAMKYSKQHFWLTILWDSFSTFFTIFSFLKHRLWLWWIPCLPIWIDYVIGGWRKLTCVSYCVFIM